MPNAINKSNEPAQMGGQSRKKASTNTGLNYGEEIKPPLELREFRQYRVFVYINFGSGLSVLTP